MTLTHYPLLVPLVMKEYSYTFTLHYGPYGLYRASVPVQGLTFTFFFLLAPHNSTQTTVIILQTKSTTAPQPNTFCVEYIG